MRRYSTLAVLALLTLVAAAQHERADVMRAMELANDYFITKYPDPAKPTFVKKERPSNLWTRGVYFEGLMALTEMERLTGGEKYDTYYKYIRDWGEAHKWTPRNGVTTRDADDYCCCQTYLDMGKVEPTRQCLDNIIEAKNTPWVAGGQVKSEGSDGDWTWIDAIQMGLPVFAKMARMVRLAGDEDAAKRYEEKGWSMYETSRNRTGGGLYNRKDGLWWRDKDFVPPYTEPNGEDCYWSRGNGWVYAALVRTLDEGVVAHREEYLKDYLAMTRALLKCQREDGFWNVSLHDESNYGGVELSGTALFIYGMAWGVRQGYLPKKKFLPIIHRTWDAMVKTCLHGNGFLGYVQGTGKEPKDSQPVSYDREPDFDDYGLGCFLLCGTEIMRLEH